MESAARFMEWDSEEGGMIDYFANMGGLRRRYKLKSLENIEIESLDGDEAACNAEVLMTFKDSQGFERMETNHLVLKYHGSKGWKIAAIIIKHT